MTYNDAGCAVGQRRAVGAGLAIGIFFMPLIFAWFLLQRGYSGVARLMAFGWLIVLLAVGISSAGSSPSADASSPPPQAQPDASAPGASKWGYSAYTDELHGAAQFATLQSDDRQHFKGFMIGSLLDMTLTAPEGGGLTIAFKTTKGGTFVCSGGDDITVKFDDDMASSFACHDADAMTGIAYLDAPKSFVEAIQGSKRMIVEPTFLVDGRKRFTFTTVGLKRQADWR